MRAHAPRPVILLVLLLALSATSPARAARPSDLPRFDPARVGATVPGWRTDRVEVRLRAESARGAVPYGTRTAAAGVADGRTGLAALDAFARASGLRLVPEFAGETPPAPGDDAPDLTSYWIAELAPGLDLADALARLAARPEVAAVEPIAVLPVAFVPDDSLWSLSTWFDQPSGRDIRARAAWDVARADSGAVIAVLDTGVLPYHPDLGGVVAGLAGALFVDRAERGGVAGVDDDGNGFVDDVSGWDFVALANGTGVSVGEDWRDADPDPNDYAGHGTAVAGLAAALTDNTIGVAGTAFGARILPVRVAWATDAAPLGLVDMSFAAQGVRYATRMGATVINCSFATLDQSGLSAAVTAAVRAGVTVVFAAGNNGQPQEVGARGDVLAVAALDAGDVVSVFSNTGPTVDVAAPGQDVASTFLTRTGADSLGLRQPAYSVGLRGTSFATPLVSGAVALLQSSRRAQGRPPLAPLDVVLRVRDTADDIADVNASGVGYGTGRLDLLRLLTDPPASLAARAGALSAGASVVLPRVSGGTTVVQAMANSRLLFLDGATLDTLRVVTLPARALRGVAAADLGGGLGTGLFVGCQQGKVAGYDRLGNVLPGWPQVANGTLNQMSGGVALGDIDGDGVTDVVCGGSDGDLWAWAVDGSVKPGFPVTLDGNPIGAAVALAQLDATPGLEIVAVTDAAVSSGQAFVVDGTGAVRPGWPALALPGAAQSPVVARVTPGSAPLVVVASGSALIGLAPDGNVRFSVSLPGAGTPVVAGDPALVDLDHDGVLEILVATTAPSLAVFDSTGAAAAVPGWPLALPATPTGIVVAGPLRPGSREGVLVFAGQDLLAFDDSARVVRRFPMPGGAGARPTLADLDGDGATEVFAGSGPDSVLYAYDAGPGTAGPVAAWPTPRGNLARTGSADGPGLVPFDDAGPLAITDLQADSVGANGIRLAWTTPADVGAAGVAAFDLRRSAVAIDDAAAFLAATPIPVAGAPGEPGTPQLARVTGLLPGDTLHVAIRAVDANGNRGARSADLRVVTAAGAPPLGRAGVLVATRAQPSRVPVEFVWQGAAEAGTAQWLRLYDVGGRLVRTLALGAGAGGRREWDGRDDRGRSVPAGLYFARLASGSFHAQTRVVLLP